MKKFKHLKNIIFKCVFSDEIIKSFVSESNNYYNMLINIYKYNEINNKINY